MKQLSSAISLSSFLFLSFLFFSLSLRSFSLLLSLSLPSFISILVSPFVFSSIVRENLMREREREELMREKEHDEGESRWMKKMKREETFVMSDNLIICMLCLFFLPSFRQMNPLPFSHSLLPFFLSSPLGEKKKENEREERKNSDSCQKRK